MATSGRPRTGKTPVKSMRIPDGVWDAAKAEAARADRTMTDVVTELLQKWIAARRREG